MLMPSSRISWQSREQRGAPCIPISRSISTANGSTAAAARARTCSLRRPRSRWRICPTPARPISTKRSKPRRKASRCGGRPRPTTAPRSCARPPTSCASATTRSRKSSCRSRARSTPRRAPRWSPRPTSSTGTRRRAAAATAASCPGASRARVSWWCRSRSASSPPSRRGTFPCSRRRARLAARCSLILKASEETPGACIETVRCFADAGLPAGVLNLVFGVPAEVSEHLLAKDAVRKISFTGSIPVGKHLAALAAKGMKRTTMELGGHSPVVVFADADPEKAADTIAAFKYRNAGQVCISPTRFYVQEDNYKKFLARFTEYAKGVKLGDGLEKGVTMGPMANARRIDAMESFVADAKSRGGNVFAGGARHGNQGFFYEPTIVTEVPDDSKVMTQEPFGPIAPIVTFKTFDEVVERANSLPYGLAAYAFTSSNATAAAIGDAIDSGMVGVNSVMVSTPETPFGGVKESGHGSEGGIEGLSAYLNTKFISQG